MHGQFHFCRRVTLFLPFPRVLRLSLSFSVSLFISRSLYGPSLRGNFFDKLFSAFFVGGCKLNPSWRLAQLASLDCPQDPDRVSPALRPSAPAVRLVLPISRRNPFAHEPSQADTKPIRAKRREHYHIAFFAEIRPTSRIARACVRARVVSRV